MTDENEKSEAPAGSGDTERPDDLDDASPVSGRSFLGTGGGIAALVTAAAAAGIAAPLAGLPAGAPAAQNAKLSAERTIPAGVGVKRRVSARSRVLSAGDNGIPPAAARPVSRAARCSAE